MVDMIVVTDWEKTDADDHYLSDEWLINNYGFTKKEARALRKRAKDGELFDAWEVAATHYAIYYQMDASRIIIDYEGNRIVSGESDVIGNKHHEAWEGESY